MGRRLFTEEELAALMNMIVNMDLDERYIKLKPGQQRLTEEELEFAASPWCFIEYESRVYHRISKEGNEVIFGAEPCFTPDTASRHCLRINLSTGLFSHYFYYMEGSWKKHS